MNKEKHKTIIKTITYQKKKKKKKKKKKNKTKKKKRKKKKNKNPLKKTDILIHYYAVEELGMIIQKNQKQIMKKFLFLI